MKRYLSQALFALLLLAAASPASAQQTIKITMSAGHPPAFLWVRVLEEFFAPEVDKRLAAAGNKYKIDWTKAWAGTLAKVGSESVAIKDGISDMGFVGTLFEGARFPLQNVTFYAPFGTNDVLLTSSIIAELQQKHPQMLEAWTKNNLVYLGGASLDSYQLFTTFPVKSLDDLKGRKVSAPGTAANWINGTGAVAVGGNLSTYFEDIKAGASEGALAFITGAWPAKLHEVAPYVTRVNIGAMYAGGIVMNKRKFDSLPPEVQKIFREVGAEFAVRFSKLEVDTAAALEKRMKDSGAKFYDLDAATRKKWAEALPDIGKIWAKDLQDKQKLPANAVLQDYMQLLRKANADLPRDWSK
ncbi:MAG: C4-dicarboxylate TRAP transporter substrate-binding protein [Rhizobiales bacterium]|jgi:TRAP-type C4-dicarboxylate transport system substrate-binding protein|nr:C4-dicarboxylate TRAP transporter substrate-binding protein [Hyphomicrobiales bacterium]